ncbi:hypothetical protein D3C78_1043930 [compost metagenome]
MGGDDDPLDFMQAIAHLWMQGDGCFTGGLSMKLGGEADLEQHMLHHVASQWLGKPEGALVVGLECQVLVGMAEQHIVEAPLRCSKHPRNAHLATQGDVRQTHTTAGGITCRPGFARAGIRCMTISTQRLAVDKGMRQCRQQLLSVGTHELGAHRCRRDLDQ